MTSPVGGVSFPSAITGLSGITGAITLGWLAAQAVASTLNFLGMRYVVFAEPSVSGRG